MKSKPKFGLFQPVFLVTKTDTGVFCDQGVITGVLFQPPGYNGSTWWYQVTFQEPMQSAPGLELPYSELAAEDELLPASK